MELMTISHFTAVHSPPSSQNGGDVYFSSCLQQCNEVIHHSYAWPQYQDVGSAAATQAVMDDAPTLGIRRVIL